MQRFGGLNGFANEWRDQYEATKPGSATAINMLGAIWGLAAAVDAMRQPPAPPKPSKRAKPLRRDPTGLGKDYDMSQYVTPEDIDREMDKLMEKCRRGADGGSSLAPDAQTSQIAKTGARKTLSPARVKGSGYQ